MKKIFNSSPLPFQGQKRNFIKYFKQELKNYPANSIFVDLFGGSGLLSHTVKSVYPNARVIYNDYDNFKERLEAIPLTNQLLSELRVILTDYPRKEKIIGETKQQVLKVLENANNNGFVDWITISSNVLFSMNYANTFQRIRKETMYNKVRLSDYDGCDYLQGVDFVRGDYKGIFNQFKTFPNVVFLVDPPYLSTDTATYNSNGYWKLRDYLDVLQVLHNNNYFYFTSNKSQIVELCDWISSVSTVANPFTKATKTCLNVSTSHNSGYTDIMYHYQK